jgi:hypothetical protein
MTTPNLPVPRFSRGNPYWKPWPAVNNAHSYLYAFTWEMNRFAINGMARFWRSPMWAFFAMQEFRKWLRGQTEEIKCWIRASREGSESLQPVQAL